MSLALDAWTAVAGGDGDEASHEALSRVDTAAHAAEALTLMGFHAAAGLLAEPLTVGKAALPFWGGAAAMTAAEVLKLLPLRGRRRRWADAAAAMCSLAGGLALRWSLVHAGPPSANDPEAAWRASRPRRCPLRFGPGWGTLAAFREDEAPAAGGDMQLDFAVFAKAAEMSSDGSFSVLGGGIEALVANEFPYRPRPFALAVRLRFPPEAAGFRSTLTVTALGPDDAELPFRAEVPIGPLRAAAPGRPIYYTALIEVSTAFSFPAAGRYVFLLRIGVAPVGETELYVDSASLKG